MQGRKRSIKCQDISVAKAPHYKGLQVFDILKSTGI